MGRNIDDVSGVDDQFSASRVAVQRARILRPVLDLAQKGEPISQALSDAAFELGVDRSHAWRLFYRLREGDGRASALEPGKRGPRPGSRRLPAEVERLIDESLRQRYLVIERPSFRRIVSEIRAECVAKGFRAPARQTIKARLDEMDKREVVRLRRGARAAQEAFAPVPGNFDVERALEVVQIDHTLADIVLVDYVERKPLQRPWLTMAIDVATRIVLGFHVGYDAPSVLSIALCLEHCFRDKRSAVGSMQESLRWPTAGIPEAVHVDNAKEFRSRAFTQACDEWGIEVRFRPPGRPHYGGHIERLIGTCMGAVHVLPGTTQSSPKNRGEYDSTKNAAMTLAEFQDWLALEVCRYHNTEHGGLGRTPMAAWASLGGDEVGRRVINQDAFRTSFMPFERRRLGRTGVRLFSVGYWSDAFGTLIGRVSEDVIVKYDPRDLSTVWVITEDKRVISAGYRDLSHPKISWWEYRRARTVFRERGGGEMPEHALFDIIREQRRLAEASRQKTQAARLDRERRDRLSERPPRASSAGAMYAVDTGNPDLPTYEIDELDDDK